MKSRTRFAAMVGAALLFTTMSVMAQAPAPPATDVKPTASNCRTPATGKTGVPATTTVAPSPPINLSVTCGERAPAKDEKKQVKEEGPANGGLIPAVDPSPGGGGAAKAKDGNNDKTDKPLTPEEIARYGMLIIGGALCLVSVLLLLAQFARGSSEGFVFRRHWGGFGDAVTGWHASPPLIRVASALVLALLGVLVLSFLLPPADKKPPPKDGGEGGGKAQVTASSK